MKKTFFYFAIIFAFSLILMSCSSGGGRDDDNVQNYYIRFKINGVQKEFTITQTDYKYHKNRKNHFLLNIGAREMQSLYSESFTIDLYVPDTSSYNLKEGQYVTNSISNYYLDIKYFDGSVWHFERVGHFGVNVVQVDKNTTKGTFAGELETGNIITDGEFYTKVQYTEVE